MAKIVLAQPDAYAGENLKELLEYEGHNVEWYMSQARVKKLYNNPPNYDAAIVDKTVTGFSEGDAAGIDCDDLVAKLKETYPDKKVICLTHPQDICKRADRNFFGMAESELMELFREVSK